MGNQLNLDGSQFPGGGGKTGAKSKSSVQPHSHYQTPKGGLTGDWLGAYLRGKLLDLSAQQQLSLNETAKRWQAYHEDLGHHYHHGEHAGRHAPSSSSLLAQLQGIEELSVDINELSSLPAELFKLFPNLRVLRASINRLRFVPYHLTASAAAPHLVELDLSHNLLECLPAELAQLRQLRILRVQGNFIQHWSPAFCQGLVCLTILDLAGNRLVALPQELHLLVALEELCVERNNIVRLPDTIHLLPALRVLRCQNNRLVTLPAKLPATLRRLNCWSNQLEQLSPSLCPATPVIDYYDNCLSAVHQLPAGLSTLNCSKNCFAAVPSLLYSDSPSFPSSPRSPLPSPSTSSSSLSSPTAAASASSNPSFSSSTAAASTSSSTSNPSFSSSTSASRAQSPQPSSSTTDDNDTDSNGDGDDDNDDTNNLPPPTTPSSVEFRSTLESLVFFQNRVTQLPLELFLLYPKLRTLDFAENEIASITFDGSDAELRSLLSASSPSTTTTTTTTTTSAPTTAASRNRMLELNLSCNLLRSDDKYLKQLFSPSLLPYLSRLDLSMNRLAKIPKGIAQLSNLEQLNVSLNLITKIPRSLQRLDNLKSFRASYNRITSLPSFFTEDKLASSLQELALQGNRLSVCPSFAKCTSLVYLSLTMRSRSDRPDTPRNLRRLYLSFSEPDLPGQAPPPPTFTDPSHSPRSALAPPTTTGKPAKGHPHEHFRSPSHALRDVPMQECVGEEERTCLTFKKFVVSFSHMMGSMGKDEDRVVLDLPADAEWGIVGILDGHGGSAVVRHLSEHLAPTLRYYLALPEYASDVHGAISAAFAACNHAVHSHTSQAHFDQQEQESGCTAVVLLISETRIVTANIGDSRAVFYPHLHRHDNERSLEPVRLSLDHKPNLPAEVQRIQMQGGVVIGDLMSKGYRISHPRSGAHSGAIAITRSFGDFGLSPLISCEPHIAEMTPPSHDDWSILLASDGVFDVMTEHMVQNLHDRVITDYPELYSAQFMASMIREMAYLFNSRDDISLCYISPSN